MEYYESPYRAFSRHFIYYIFNAGGAHMNLFSIIPYIAILSIITLSGCASVSDNWSALDYSQPGDVYDISQLYEQY